MDAPKEFLESLKAGDVAKVQTMLRKDPSLVSARTKSGATPILFALYVGRRDLAEHIASKKPELDIYEAAALARLDRMRELVEQNPELVNAPSPEGFPPLGLAAYLGQAEVVRFLLSKGADVNFAATGTGFTALTGAVAGNHATVVEILLRHGANANHRYEDGGSTPLFEAAASGNADIVRLLLIYGADVNARMKDGKTPLGIATEKGHRDAADVLRRSGAAV